jgi:hypothetical protein
MYAEHYGLLCFISLLSLESCQNNCLHNRAVVGQGHKTWKTLFKFAVRIQRGSLVEMKRLADNAFYVANQMSMN